MSTEVLTNSGYRVVHDGLRRLHELFLDGKARSDEAEAIRDASEGPWQELSKEQRSLLSGLSKDLNDIKHMTGEDTGGVANPVFAKVFDFLHTKRYAEAFDLLRANKAIPPFSRISFARGRLWEEMGEPRTALLFFNHAAKLAPGNDQYQASALSMLCAAYPEQGQAEVERVLDPGSDAGPLLLIEACEIKFQEALKDENDETSNRACVHIVDGLRLALQRMVAIGRRASMWKPAYCLIYSMLASCYRSLGDLDTAYDFYSAALGLDRLNTTLLIARGSMAYGKSPFALEDIDEAIRLGTDLALPYYFLSHYLLTIGQFEPALKAIEQGLRMTGTKRMKSELLEFKAIGMAHQPATAGNALKYFNEAIAMDNTNERARKNLHIFQTVLSKPTGQEDNGANWDVTVDENRVSREVRGYRPTIKEMSLVGV